MKIKKINITLVILIIIYFSFLFIRYTLNNEVQEVASKNSSQYYEIKNYKENKKGYEINVYYPHTKIEALNNYINLKIYEYINNFIILQETKQLENIMEKNSINITFDVTETGSYISFLFRIIENLNNIHPETFICTVNYNKRLKKIINISELISKYPDILIDISNYSYKELINNEKIKTHGAYSMLELGTKSSKTNYKNFIISDKGMVIYFEQKQIAPYILGEFKVYIPFGQIGIENF